MISVIIPLYNKGKSITNTITKVLEQTYHDFEIIVVDDGSTDNGPEEVLKLQDKRIRLIHQKNAGVSAARNRGIKEAQYDLIAFLDADDEWMPDYLQTQYELSLKYPDCSVFACNYEFHDEENNIKHTHYNNFPFDSNDGILINYFDVASVSSPPIWTSAVVVNKMALESIAGFPAGVTLGEDLITWARLACRYSIAYSRKVEAIYNFRTQKQLVTPRRAPDKNDYVGQELAKLFSMYGKTQIGLYKYVALWHKMRMVTYIRLGMKKEARYEYSKIKKYIKPDYKCILWNYLNFLPYKLIRFILFQIAKLK